MELNTIKLDPKKITGGVWWALERLPDGTLGGRALRGEPADEPALCVKPAGVEFERALEAARRPYLVEIRDRRLPPETERKILAEAVAEALWVGAQNLTVGGEPLAYNKERGQRMLAEPAWWNLCDFILAVSRDRAAVLADEEAKAAGNS